MDHFSFLLSFQPKRQSSATFQSKAASASLTSARAQHFQSLFAQHSRISKSLSSDLLPVPDSSLYLSTIHKSVTHALLAGSAPETEPQVGLGPGRIPSLETSTYQWPSYSEIGLWKHVTESSSPSLGRGPPMRAKKDDVVRWKEFYLPAFCIILSY